MYNPFLEKAWVIALHQLKAAVEVWLDPTLNVLQTFRHHSSLLSVSLIHGSGIAILEALDHYE
jgi:hypothetical protein